MKKRTDADFADEVEAHIAIEADRLVDEGMSPKEARAAARRTFGNVTRSREAFHESGRWAWAERLGRDVRYAFRRMRAAPLSTATVVASLALGIGFNTAIFSLADQALLRSLPVENPQELVQLEWSGNFAERGMGSVGYGALVPYALYQDLRAGNDVFEDLLASAPFQAHVAATGEAEPATAEVVTGGYFSTLGVRAAAGRLLTDDDDRERDAHPVVALSHGYWMRRFAGDRSVVGSSIRVNNYPMTVVGVAEESFQGLDWGVPADLWVPLKMKEKVTPGWYGLEPRRSRFLHVFGRLKPGIEREQAQARLEPWFKNYLQADTEQEDWPRLSEQQMNEFMASDLNLLPGGRGESLVRQRVREPIWILLAATAMVLLLACLNVANLSLGRVLARARTTALHSALGATRGRLLREQFVESALLAAAGCVAGLAAAPPVNRLLISLLPAGNAGNRDGAAALSASLDLRVLAFAAGVAALTALLSGMAPALYAASTKPIEALKRQSAGVAGGLGLRKALVAAQFAAALILLIGAGLFTQTLATLRSEGPGYSTSNLLMFRLQPATTGYGRDEAKPLIRRVLAQVQALPEVESAGIGRFEMLTGGGWNNPVTIRADRRFATDENITMNAVSPEFFETLGASIVAGRSFDERDGHPEARWNLQTAIVNQEFVDRYFNGKSPIGAFAGIGSGPDTDTPMEIVGVTQDFHDRGLRSAEPQIYFPLWELPAGDGTFYVRARSSSEAAARSIRATIRDVDPALAVLSLRTIEDQLDRLLGNERMLATLAGAFAVTATLLAMIGLYGVLAFSAARRTKEMGIRLALGAPRLSAGGLIVREAALLAGIGLVVALPLIWTLGRLVESQLFGVTPTDLSTIAAAAGVLGLVCLVASAIPARKAGAVNPLEALRAE